MTREQEKAMFAKHGGGRSYKREHAAHTFILPTGKGTYVFVGADNRVDAFSKMQRLYPDECEGKTYSDVMSHADYKKQEKGAARTYTKPDDKIDDMLHDGYTYPEALKYTRRTFKTQGQPITKAEEMRLAQKYTSTHKDINYKRNPVGVGIATNRSDGITYHDVVVKYKDGGTVTVDQCDSLQEAKKSKQQTKEDILKHK